LIEVNAVGVDVGSDDDADMASLVLVARGDRVQQVQAVVGREKAVDVQVRNPHPNRPIQIRFQSANPHQVAPEQPKIDLGPNEVRMARFIVKAAKGENKNRVEVGLETREGSRGAISFMLDHRRN